MEGVNRPTPELLLEHVSWIRRLARHLVVDPVLAEDLAQETCVVALERPPRDASQVKRWLASVLRNLVRQRARGDGRRRGREESSARDEAQDPTERLVERVEVERSLVEHVLALDEPYRTAVLWRFFEDEPPREIARRLGVPVTTVNSRIARGLARLRADLDGTWPRRSWSALLLPLAARWQPATATTLGGLIVNAKLITALVLVAAGAGVYAVIQLRGAEARAVQPDARIALRAEPAPVAEPEESAGEADPAREPEAGRTLLAPQAPARAERPAAEAPPAATRLVRGRVIDVDGQPVGGVELWAEDERVAVSGGGGGFEFTTEAAEGSLSTREAGRVTVRSGAWGGSASLEPLVVVAPAGSYAGRVVDAAGRGLDHALVRLALPEGFVQRLGEVLDATHEESWVAITDAGGGFRLERVPLIVDAQLRASLEGFEPAGRWAPPASAEGIVLVLERPAVPLSGSLAGRVVEGGRGVPGARVAVGVTSVLCDEDGEFRVDLARAVTAERIVAVHPGFQPGELRRPGEPVRGPDGRLELTGWPEHVVVPLGPPARSLRGRVVDHEGEAVAGARVWVEEPTPFGAIGQMPTPLEGLMAGAPVPPQAAESVAALPPVDGDHEWTFQMRAPDAANVLWPWVETDADGAFLLTGLLDRDYRLSVLPEDGLEIFGAGPFAAGDGREILVRLDAPSAYERLAGRVVTDAGQPVAGVEIGSWIPVVDRRGRVFGGSVQVVLTRRGPRVTTDDAGAFALADIPRKGARLELAAESIVPTDVPLDDLADPRALRLVVEARCHLVVELESPHDRVDEIEVEGEDGTHYDLLRLSKNSVNAVTSVRLVDGKSGVLSVTSRARRLVLWRDGEVVDVLPLDLRPGDVNRIRY